MRNNSHAPYIIDAPVQAKACISGARTGIDFGSAAKREPVVETRLIIAYSLIAMMAAIAIFGGIMLSRKREKARDRDAGRGGHL